MGLVEHAAGDVQQVAQPFADQLLGRDSDPVRKGTIGSDNATVGLQREIAAWRVLEEVLQVFGRAWSQGTGFRQSRGSPR